MTASDPPTSSDGSPLPSRHRPVLGDLSKDTTEMDLWSLDDDLSPQAEIDPPILQVEAPPVRRGEIPARREARKSQPGTAPESGTAGTPEEPSVRMQMKIGKPVPRSQSIPQGPPSTRQEAEFADLEGWDDVPHVMRGSDFPELPGTAEPSSPEEDAPSSGGTGEEAPALSPEPAPAPEPAVAPEQTVADSQPEDEFSPAVSKDVQPVSLRPSLGLNGLERSGLVLLFVLLLGCGVLAYWYSLNRIPSKPMFDELPDLPVKGSHVSISGLVNYWRAPNLTGPNPDVVRRGTAFLPVLEVTVSEGSGAIRVIFRNDEYKPIGDPITRQIEGPGSFSISATAGFDDIGMHAAYRVGAGRPWTAEILEAASADDASFKKLLEVKLSPTTR